MISKNDADLLKRLSDGDKIELSSNKSSEGLHFSKAVKEMCQLINLMIV
jgi:hypothetical protein